MVFLLLHIAIMAPPYVQGGGIGPNVYDKLNVASMGKVTTAFDRFTNHKFWLIMDHQYCHLEH